MDAKIKSYYHTNQQLWNKLARVHPQADFYNMSSFVKGQTSLNQTELEELGTLAGLDVLHLQCHFGMDSISLKRAGANRVLGIDFSEEAIKKARLLAQQLEVQVAFQQANVLEFQPTDPFDLVFTSYGVLCWLHDLTIWANMVARSLKKNGIFYMIEFHPALMMFEMDAGPMIPTYSYFKSNDPFEEYMEHSYTGSNESVGMRNYSWNYPISDVFNALTKAGLEVLYMHEFLFKLWMLSKHETKC